MKELNSNYLPVLSYKTEGWQIIKKINYNDINIIKANIIENDKFKLEKGDTVQKVVYLKTEKAIIPPGGGNGRGKGKGKDPYVRRSELKRELNTLETRIKIEFNAKFDRIDAKFDDVNKRIDQIDSKFEAKFDEVNKRIGNIESILHLILNKLDIRQ